MKHVLKFLVLIVAISTVGQKKESQSDNNKVPIGNYSFKIDSLLLTNSPRRFNGVVLITEDGKTTYFKAYGYSNFEKKIPLVPEDNFRIMSNSKQITAALTLKEVEKGNIDLLQNIKSYLPNLEQSWADSVNVHQLLNMSSGIEELDRPLLFEPGTDFHYSNPGYGLLGRIIHEVSGKPYIEVANHFFQELGMKNTYCYEFVNDERELVNGYRKSKQKLELVNFEEIGFTKETWEDFIPTGGIISNLKDLSIWDEKLHNGKILSPSLYRLMVNSKVLDADDTFSDVVSNYGYGVNIHEGKPFKYIGHKGRGFGFVNIKFYVPKLKLNVIVLENFYVDSEDTQITYHFEKEIRKIVLNGYPIK